MVKNMKNKTTSLREENIQEWSRLYGRQISETEYDEICQTLKGFFGILHRWDKEQKEAKK